MTDDDTSTDDHDEADDDTGTSDELDKATVQGWIREALADLKSGESAPPSSDDAEPLTLKAVEAAARRAVEDAMKPLREDSPAKGSPSRLRAFMWGGSDD